MSLKSLYKQDLMDHFKKPKNFRVIQGASFSSPYMHPSCGDKIVVMGVVENGIIKDLAFQGSGCVLSIAMASKLTEHACGLPVQGALKFDEQLVFNLLKIDLGPKRIQCGMLSIIALHRGLKLLENNI